MYLPDDCAECASCGVPIKYNEGYCDHCELSAAERLGLAITVKWERNGVVCRDYKDPKTGKDAYWRVAGLLKRWSR